MISLALDLGGTNIKLALIRNDSIIKQVALPALSKTGLRPRLDVIKNAVNKILNEFDTLTGKIHGVGVAFPGLVDVHSKKVISTNAKYDDALSIDLVQWINDHWELPMVIDNDARMALRGEWQYGAGKGVDNLVMITLGTGVGGATLINGEILYGKHYQAGCLGGHFTINFQGITCTCGNIGCVESEASGWRLPGLVKDFHGFESSSLSQESELNFEVLFKYARQNDVTANEVLNYCLDVWSAGIISMIHAYDPEMVIISGGIMQSGDMIIPKIQEKVNQNAWTPWGNVRVLPARFINEAVLLGANYMVKQLKK